VSVAQCNQLGALCPLLSAAKIWDSRSYCCSRHTAYSNLGLAVLLLLTAHSLYIHTWDSRSYCCSRHTVYSYLGLTALLLVLTAHSLYTIHTWDSRPC
jgi:hypothetical protein